MYLEVDCRQCENCTGNSCICYGNDANVATDKCAKDNFKNYKIKEEINES